MGSSDTGSTPDISLSLLLSPFDSQNPAQLHGDSCSKSIWQRDRGEKYRVTAWPLLIQVRCLPPSPNPGPVAGGGQGPHSKPSLGSHLVPLLSRLCKFLNLSSFQLLLCKVITLTIPLSPGCYEVQSYTKRPPKRPCHTITTGSYCFSSYHPIILYPQLPSEGGIPLCQFSLSSGGAVSPWREGSQAGTWSESGSGVCSQRRRILGVWPVVSRPLENPSELGKGWANFFCKGQDRKYFIYFLTHETIIH